MNELTIIEQPRQLAEQAAAAELLARYRAYVDAGSPKTCETYERALKQMFKYFMLNGINAINATRADIIAYKEYLKAAGRKPTTIQNYIAAAKLFYRWTAQEGITATNPADHIKSVKLSAEHKKDYLTSKQVKAVLQSIKTDTLKGKRDFAIFALMVTCGLRDTEVSTANINDMRILADDTVIYIKGKGRTEKTENVKITPPVEKAIREYLKERGETNPAAPLFGSLNRSTAGQAMTTRSISRVIKNCLINAGYNSERLTAHSLRHTAVTLSLKAEKPLEEVRQFARHRNIQTTLIYSHALDAAQNTCSAAITAAIFS